MPKTRNRFPSVNQTAFVQKFVEQGLKNPLEAFKAAYPNAKGKFLSQDAQKLLRDPRIKDMIDQIQQDCRAQFVIIAPEALERLEELAEGAESEMVKLKANIEILDRGGLGAPQKVELQHLGVFGTMGVDEIKEIVRKNIEEGSTKKKE